MRKLYTLLIAIFLGVGLNAQLSTGDILFVGFNADGTDQFAFVTLVDIPANTDIYFTDNEWNGVSPTAGDGFFDLNEGELTWNHTAIVSAGTVITIDADGGGGSPTASVGLVSGSNLNLGASNEELYALSVAPALSGITASDMLSGIASDLNSDLIGSGLVVGTNFIDFDNDFDGFAYTATTGGEAAFTDYTAFIMNTANWQQESSDGNLAVPNFPIQFTLAGAPVITVSTTSITGLDYLVGTGPSASQNGVISSSNLSGALTGLGSGSISSFEFSVDNTTWTAAFPGPLPGAALNVSPTTVYVRLVSGLPVGTYNATITLTNTGGVPSNAAPVDFTFEGAVTAPVPDIIINEFQADPDAVVGDANGDGNVNTSEDEFVELYNNEAVSVDLSGWTLSDGVSVRHTFPASTIVPAGGFITVFGGGTLANFTGVGGIVQVASGGSLGLNNGGDVITLETGAAQLVATYSYGSEGGNDQSIGRDPDFTGPFVLHTGIVALGRDYSPGEVNVSPPSACSITSISAATPGACSPATNTYSVDLTVSYSTPPATGSLDVNGQLFAITTSPQTITLTGLAATGAAEDVTAVFTADGTCSLTETALYTAPSPCFPTIPACTELFFSEYIEGSSSNKCIEIYNPTNTDIDLAAGVYAISRFNNGSTTDSGPWALSGIVPAYGTYVICNSSADPGFQALADSVGGFFNGITFYNGDDVLTLTKSGVNIDVIGQLGVDPGSAWSNAGVSTANQTLVRMAGVQAGDNVASDPFDPSTEWMSLGIDDFSNLGQHNSDCAPFVWTGLTSTDYHTGSNWTKGTVPLFIDHAWIPTNPLGGVFPIAGADVDLSLLTIRSGASLNIAPTFGLILVGGATNNGTLTLESDATGTAWLDDFTNSSVTFTGDLTVQTYISTGSGLGQRYFGSPVSSGTVSGLDATYASGYPMGQIVPLATCDPTQLAPGSPYSNLFQWNEDANFPLACVQEGWEAISASTPLTPVRGYSGWVNDGSIISVVGPPNTGNVDYITSGVSSPSVAGATGWHVLSNPFPSAFDVVSAASLSGFSSAQVYNGASGPFSGSFLPALVAGPVAVMQGFVAEASTPGSQTFEALGAFRIPGNQQWQKPEFGHMLSIEVLGNGHGDQSFVYFKHDVTDQFDPAADCKKKQSDAGYPTLFTDLNGEMMSLNGLSSNNMTRSIDLGLLPGANSAFTMSFDGLESFPATSLIFLEDKLTGDFVNIRENEAYTFDANMNDDADRFVLHFTAPIEIASTSTSCAGDDAELSIDFGQYAINNNPITWDYSLTQNAGIIADAQGQNGLLNLSNLDKGSYTLELQNGAYTLEILVEIDGAEKVLVDFENPIAVEEGTLVNLANLSTGAVLNTWTVEGQYYTSVDLSHVFSVAGSHEIVLDASNADCEASLVKTIEVSAKTTGIKDAVELDNARVYTQSNTIVIDLSSVSNSTAYTASIFNLLGQKIHQQEISNSITKINVKESGNYFLVQLVQGQTQKVFKVLLK